LVSPGERGLPSAIIASAAVVGIALIRIPEVPSFLLLPLLLFLSFKIFLLLISSHVFVLIINQR
jgi:hypothetical protein